MRCLFGAGFTLLRGPCKVSKKPGQGGSVAAHRSRAATFESARPPCPGFIEQTFCAIWSIPSRHAVLVRVANVAALLR